MDGRSAASRTEDGVMRNVLWVALTTAVLTAGIRADEPPKLPDTVPPPPPPITHEAMGQPPAPPIPAATLAPYGTLLSGPYSECANACSPCTTGQCGGGSNHVWKRGWSRGCDNG